jgi:CubicO group peptidase (beta-lactamase class C family)
MKKLKFTLLFALTLTLIMFLLPRQEIKSDNAKNIDEYLIAKMEEVAIPGMAISVIKDNKVILLKGYGYANVDNQKKIDIHTPFNIASISKPILGISLLKLVDQGRLNLDQNINSYLPFRIDNPKINSKKITVRHLVTHTSSINDYYDIDTYAINQDAEISLSDHIKSLLTREGSLYNNAEFFKNVPIGTERDYSNLGAGVAGLVLESITGKSLADFSSEEIFQPLGMENTGWRLADFELDELTTRYNVRQCVPFFNLCADANSPKSNFLISKIFNPPLKNKSFIEYPHYGNPQYPDGGVNSSIHDLTILIKTLLNEGKGNDSNLLSEKSFMEMFKLQLPDSLSTRQRFFWRDNKEGLTGHSGSDLGVFTSAYFDLKKQNAVIILMNRDVDAVTEKAMDEIREKLLNYNIVK